jgi:hypothetical protein
MRIYLSKSLGTVAGRPRGVAAYGAASARPIRGCGDFGALSVGGRPRNADTPTSVAPNGARGMRAALGLVRKSGQDAALDNKSHVS